MAVAVLTPAAAPQFASSVNLVEVYATVTDRKGEPVTGLTAEAFEVFEEGQRQEVTVFTAGEMGLSVAVALDRSFSMAGERLTAMSRASEQFLLALRPADRAMLVGIGSRVEVLAPLAADRTAGLRALATLDAFGSTSLHDAIIRALDEIQPASGRRALVLLSDGVDRYSRASEADVLDRARRGDVLVYPIAIGEAAAAAVRGAGERDGRPFGSRDGLETPARHLEVDRQRTARAVSARLHAGPPALGQTRMARACASPFVVPTSPFARGQATGRADARGAGATSRSAAAAAASASPTSNVPIKRLRSVR